jgi:hypothetical protein
MEVCGSLIYGGFMVSKNSIALSGIKFGRGAIVSKFSYRHGIALLLLVSRMVVFVLT